jgi:uncharacterized protein
MPKPYTAHAAQSIGEIDAAEWDACANPEADTARLGAPPPGPQSQCIKEQTACEVERYNPFITHAFLKSLETSRSVGPKTGWISAHVLVRDAIGRLAAAAPAYFKTHSMGEYVFDHGWADAYHHAGMRYYPKTASRRAFHASHRPPTLACAFARLPARRERTPSSAMRDR